MGNTPSSGEGDTPSSGKGDVTGKIIEDKVTIKEKDKVFIVAPRNNHDGNVVGMRIKKGGGACIESKGGVEMIGGVSDAIQQYAIRTVAGDKLKVSVKYSDFSGRFEGNFRPNDSIYDVMVEIFKERKDIRLKNIVAKNGQKLSEDMKISTLKEHDLLEDMKAILA